MSFFHFLRIGYLEAPIAGNPHWRCVRSLGAGELAAIERELPEAQRAGRGTRPSASGSIVRGPLAEHLDPEGTLRIRYINVVRYEPLGLHVALIGGRLFGLLACDHNARPPYTPEQLTELLAKVE